MKVLRSTALPACLQVIHQLFYFLDEADYTSLVKLFTSAGCWERQGELLTGRPAILRGLSLRPATQRIRHLITNGFLMKEDQTAAELVAYTTSYRFDNGVRQDGPVAISRPFRLSIVKATLECGDGAWQVSDLRLTPEFEFVAEARGQ